MTLTKANQIAEQDYLTAERKSLDKHEYYKGEVFAMSGASIPPNLVFSNVFGILSSKLRGKNCKPFGSDLRVHIPQNTLYTYPDITIVCGKIETLHHSFDTITNPAVIIEILSASTRDYDKGGKFTLYRDIASLHEYLLIDSERVSIEKFMRNADGSWQLTEYKEPEQHVRIETVDLAISLLEVYEDIMF